MEKACRQPSGWVFGLVLKLYLDSRHGFYLDCRFMLGWLKVNGGLLAPYTATKGQWCPCSPGFKLSMPDLITKLCRVLAWALSLFHPVWPAHSLTGEAAKVSKEETLSQHRNCEVCCQAFREIFSTLKSVTPRFQVV